ncbi:MAG: alanine--tRNA ligase [Bacilli bacterium]|nr:alanine--tRNA ligase [Bacilli bacterium]
MRYMTGQEIRETWLNFFKSKGHHVEKGASLIPYQDPTLLWINSGVAALKKYMDGSEVPPSRRITNVQKSIRTNDIENVGFTARHHTFFEMLGNFSIGDYFKKEVIPFAFEILTSEKYFGMPKDKLYFTYNPIDEETHQLWLKEGVEESHLIPLEGNYWEIGEGPAGPNTEVFFDRGEKYDPDHLGERLLREEIENDRYIEIWGIVFSQYNAVPGTPRSEYKELPSKNIDTGAGLERIASVLQQTDSNFETDLFMPIIKAVEKLAKVPYEKPYLTNYRVIADHIRAVTFAIADGEIFSNEGRGYVLRRLVRRAMRFAKQIGIEKPFMYTLVDVVINIYAKFYPENVSKGPSIAKMVKAEEEKFLETLETGESILREMIVGKKELSGPDAFKLYDTFGFPIDLTVEICAEKGVKVDRVGFEKEMEKQKERARQARSNAQSMHKQSKDLLEFTEPSSFVYDEEPLDAVVIGCFKDGVRVKEITDEGEVILSQTNFYAESGGEVADTGELSNNDTSLEVYNVIKAPNKQHLHAVNVKRGSIKEGDKVHVEINVEERRLTERNHSVTHLLQAALDKVLGNHIKQMGSYVCKDYMRFDFTHYTKISDEELKAIEKEVNRMIAEAIPSNIRVMSIAEANKLGAKAFFSEKYGDEVRVVAFGNESIEFCGGCHVKNTADIGVFVIESESSIASGVRRIEGRSSVGAYELIKERQDALKAIVESVGATNAKEAKDKIHSILEQLSEANRRLTSLMDQISQAKANDAVNQFIDFKGYKVLTKYVKGASMENLNAMGDDLKTKFPDYAILLIGGEGNSLPISIFIGGEALRKNMAGNLVREVAKHLGGGGGGRPNMANGSGRDESKIQSAIELFKETLQ